jgi:hypothetical protein
MDHNGFITLKQPQGLSFSDVWLGSGRHVKPDHNGHLLVGPGEASSLLAVGWTIVPPAPPAATARWKPPAAAA